MTRRTLAAVLTPQNASSSDSSIFVAYDVESDDEVARRKSSRGFGCPSTWAVHPPDAPPIVGPSSHPVNRPA